MASEPNDNTIGALAAAIRQRGLLTPARIMLDLLAPVDMIASQVSLFARPFVPQGRWRSYVALLETEAGWKALRRALDDQGG